MMNSLLFYSWTIGSDPVLPDNLNRLQASFTRPSSMELLSHLYKVCAYGAYTNDITWISIHSIHYCFSFRFVLLKESASNHTYLSALFIIATEIYGKPLCIFSSGARVQDLEVSLAFQVQIQCNLNVQLFPNTPHPPTRTQALLFNHFWVFLTIIGLCDVLIETRLLLH